jgi:hypothetical protein
MKPLVGSASFRPVLVLLKAVSCAWMKNLINGRLMKSKKDIVEIFRPRIPYGYEEIFPSGDSA